jgi:hypothetical protein
VCGIQERASSALGLVHSNSERRSEEVQRLHVKKRRFQQCRGGVHVQMHAEKGKGH